MRNNSSRERACLYATHRQIPYKSGRSRRKWHGRTGVLSGSAAVEFADDCPPLRLGPGDVVRLAAGARTVWTVTETLRKVYVTGG